jgi:hypothetical protein
MKGIFNSLLSALALAATALVFAGTDILDFLASGWWLVATVAVIACLWVALFLIWRRAKRGLTLVLATIAALGVSVAIPNKAAACMTGDAECYDSPSPANEQTGNCRPGDSDCYTSTASTEETTGNAIVDTNNTHTTPSCTLCSNLEESKNNGKTKNAAATDMFLLLFSSMDWLTTTIFNRIAASCVMIVKAGALIAMCLTILQVFVPCGTDIDSDYLKSLITLFFRVMFAVVLLKNGSTAFGLLIEPFFNGTVGLSQIIVFGDVNPKVEIDVPKLPDNTMLGTNVVTSLAKIVQALYEEVSQGLAIAGQAVCLGWYHAKCAWAIRALSFFVHVCVDPHLVFIGSIMWICYAIVLVLYPLYLVDAMIRLMFVIAFLPVFIMLWVFKITAEYSKKAFDIMIDCCQTILFSSLVLKIVLKLYASALGKETGTDSGKFAAELWKACTMNVGGYDKMADLLTSDGKVWSAITLAIIAYVGWKSFTCVDKYVAHFSAKHFSFSKTDENKKPTVSTAAILGAYGMNAVAWSRWRLNNNAYKRRAENYRTAHGGSLTGFKEEAPKPFIFLKKFDTSGALDPRKSDDRSFANLMAHLAYMPVATRQAWQADSKSFSRPMGELWERLVNDQMVVVERKAKYKAERMAARTSGTAGVGTTLGTAASVAESAIALATIVTAAARLAAERRLRERYST